MTEGARAADEVRVPLGAPPPGPAALVGASPESPGAPGREAERGSELGVSPSESPAAERGAELGADEEQRVPYPALAATVFFCLGQTTRPRSWCLRLVCNPYPSRPAGGGGRGAWGGWGPGARDSLGMRPRAPLLVGPGVGRARGGAGQGLEDRALISESGGLGGPPGASGLPSPGPAPDGEGGSEAACGSWSLCCWIRCPCSGTSFCCASSSSSFSASLASSSGLASCGTAASWTVPLSGTTT
uniref:Calcium voltage-gated channel subunit alpha1 H n=1 Tax=Homo sapiens TaxID=9606 RepID=A0AAA9YHM5_HUMAN